MKILITGFEPFDGAEKNPSWEAVNGVTKVPEGVELKRALLPTVYKASSEMLMALMLKHRPDAVLGFGLAGIRSEITVERIAVNLADARIPDNSGAQPVDEPLFEDGPAAYFATLPAKEICGAINDAGVKASLSNTAGLFVCNSVMYSALYFAEKYMPDTKAGFIHIPGGSDPADDIKAAEAAIAAAAKSLQERGKKMITIVYMQGCPYCRMARKAVEELGAEGSVTWVDENAEPAKIKDLDYYYVPSIFDGTKKLFEAHPGDDYEKIRDAVQAALDLAK